MRTHDAAPGLLEDLEFSQPDIQEEIVMTVLTYLDVNRNRMFADTWRQAVVNRLAYGDTSDEFLYRLLHTRNFMEVAAAEETPSHILEHIIRGTTKTILIAECLKNPNVGYKFLKKFVKYQEYWSSIPLNDAAPADILDYIDAGRLSRTAFKHFMLHPNLSVAKRVQVFREMALYVQNLGDDFFAVLDKVPETEVNILAGNAHHLVISLYSTHPELRLDLLHRALKYDYEINERYTAPELVLRNRNLDFETLQDIYRKIAASKYVYRNGFEVSAIVERVREIPGYEGYPYEWVEALLAG